MAPLFADRISHLGTEASFEMLAKTKALERHGKKVIHMEIGDPDFDTPENIKEAAIRAIREGFTHYVPAPGIFELREAIAEYISKTRKIEVDPDEVVVGPGAKQILFLLIQALVNPGEEVLYPSPAYPAYESLIKFVGARPVPIPQNEDRDFRIEHEYVKEKITKKTKMVILNSPENPTGGVLTREDLRLIADCISNRDDIIVISDEIYSRIIYEGEHESIASIPGMKDRTIILDGFSKTYAMTGWRLGYGVMRKDIAQTLTKLVINSNACTCAFVQVAGIEALRGPQDSVRKMIEEFKRRRDIIVSGLSKVRGIKCKAPRGTFYAFPNIKETKTTSQKLADYLLHEAGVAVLPGTAFGAQGEGHLRLSFTNSVENIKEALARISDALEKLS